MTVARWARPDSGRRLVTMRPSRLAFLVTALFLSPLLATAATYVQPNLCPTTEELLRTSIECSSGGGRAGMVQDGACRRIKCTELPICHVTRPSETRIQQLERKAYAGSTDAMLALGMMYYTGQGASQNDVRAFAWLVTAESAGAELPDRDAIEQYFADNMSEREIDQATVLMQTIRSRSRQQDSSATAPPPAPAPTQQASVPASRDNQRKQDVTSVMSGLAQYSVDRNGAFPSPIPAEPQELCASKGVSCRGLLDLGALVPTYLPAIPRDPRAPKGDGTGYYVSREPGGRVTVSAPLAETGLVSITR